MLKRVTTYLFLLAGLFIVGNAVAQPQQVTVREINAIAQENVDALNAGGASLTVGDITPLVTSTLDGTEVTFTAVVLTDPRSSGLSNLTDGQPNRIHIYVRDTSAVSSGVEGMGVQIVDGAYATTGSDNLLPGDVITVTGAPAVFSGSGGNSLQINVTAITLEGSYTDLSLPETLLDPVLITSSDANSSIDDQGGIQINWNNLASLNGQFVRLEGATITARDISSERPNWLISSDDGETVLSFYDVSLRYRNDRSDYPDGYNVLEDDFVPPPPGSRVNLQGYLVYQGDDPFGRSVPGGALLSIAPFADSDLEITESPPIITDVTGPDFVPDGSAAVDVTAAVTADPSRTLTGVVLKYTTTDNETEQEVNGAEADGVYTFSIPGQADGVFVTFTVEATDSEGAVSTSDAASYRTLADGIDEIADVQTTADEGPGDSPYRNITTAMNINAVIASDPTLSGIISIQDDADLGAWSGVLVDADPTGLAKGDSVTITEATVEERFGVTQLADVVWSVTSSGNAVNYKVVPTTALLDDATAEAHEGMLLRFENVVVGVNPDDPNDFGEWAFASADTEDFIRADDASDDIPSEFNDMLTEGTQLEFIQGIWWYSFGNYKLVPETADDVFIVGTAIDDETLPGRFALDQNFPNPFNPSTSIRYEVQETGRVTLEVFDILGRQVEMLVDGVISAGEYSVTFDAHNLPSGMYLYRLTAGNNVSTKKMLLLK